MTNQLQDSVVYAACRVGILGLTGHNMHVFTSDDQIEWVVLFLQLVNLCECTLERLKAVCGVKAMLVSARMLR